MNFSYFQYFVLLMLFSFLVDSEAQNEKYWVKLSDKNFSNYSIDKPEEFLSARSIARRQKQGIAIISTDLPVSQLYLDSILQTGAKVLCTSKWLNGVTIETSNTEIIGKIKQFAFVDTVQLSWVVPTLKSANLKLESPGQKVDDVLYEYGNSKTQIALHNGDIMHQKGYTGDGMLIAILDAGFQNANSVSSLAHLYNDGRILGTRDYVNPQSNIYTEHEHGMEVLSTMGGYEPGTLIGTAFDASFYLIRTEDANSEQPVELDYWVAGAEFADSLGADLINSSLGYYSWDLPFTDNTYKDMDGKTMRASIGAGIAASKGIIITNSAGNEGDKWYGKLVSPSDALGVVCVGSIDKDSTSTSFSSTGFSYDGRIKPNLVANGRGAVVQLPGGSFNYANGTSFSSPITCGLLAILWQSLPHLSAQEIINLAQHNAHLYDNPDIYFGYGIPDIWQAYSKATEISDTFSGKLSVYPNPFHNSFNIILPEFETANISVYSVTGQLVQTIQNILYVPIYEMNIDPLPQGSYIIKLSYGNSTYAQLISKQ